ncbi:SANT SWI3, ADA2, N-coR and TFIIIB'' DNA-binding domain-containing protein [Thermochaetoides thermophila DSM 1495]|uniref:SANT SWI3, ADA2, N-coR and TFIIIB'' DNA-binding domain-containing protein n=1 Tax=Chaetomium thermophilum (strain DSM 1495 / CBS 144.50 / IMI 039719) TaxID=759272 RepID=G0SFL5_CHATD|nr:SANT SWI3, ADA2, N-coR and TFIIIB'' DNA-binding domain-containing protein [Thermochaetoides thermophila DSM 1495]EGS17780.1 SANT SWI3, ADA2, N-coR and TFIIIB'' DNA-binding domain-containing protein [Thermochaetoides thermophila DSM 1495]
MLTDPSAHLAGRHISHPGPPPPHFGPAPPTHGVVAPLYPSLTATPGPAAGVKRPRPDDLDLGVSGMPELGHGDLESMQQAPPPPMGPPYGQTTAPPPPPPSVPPTHHHHRLPETGPPAKMMRRDGEGGSSSGHHQSMVGQPGMPPPAARPKGPKLKFTPEDDQLLIDLKENKNLTWKQIADFFPGRSSGTLQVRYCTKLKAKTTQWTEELDNKLKAAIQDYENEKWRIIANKVGTGFTPAACRERAMQLLGENAV